MFTQIYSIQTVDEALACVNAGADAIGIACNVGKGLRIPAAVSLETGQAIFSAVRPRAVCVALTVSDDREDIFALAESLSPDILHVCGNHFYIDAAFAAAFKSRFPEIGLLQAIPVIDEESYHLSLRLAAFCDYLILDSVAVGIDGIGAAGITHDWQLSKRIADALRVTKCKVILAGGLGPHNVRDAIKTVQPWGVDSFTRTSVPIGNGNTKKDPALVHAFITNAKETAKELGL